uniref:Uncharacterized protein n=1 Tax=Oryza barthii TaxID=65489 RepID=A0A0D3GFB5_9ORYZ
MGASTRLRHCEQEEEARMGGDKVSVPAVEDELHIERCRPTSSLTSSPSSAPSMTSCFQLLQAPSFSS